MVQLLILIVAFWSGWGVGGGGEPDLFGAGIPRSVSRAARFLENCLVDLRFSN